MTRMTDLDHLDVDAIVDALSDLRDTLPGSVTHLGVGVHTLSRIDFDAIPASQRHFPADSAGDEFWAKDLVTEHGTIAFYTREAPTPLNPEADAEAYGIQVPS